MKSTILYRWSDALRRFDLDPRLPNVGANEIAAWLSDDVRSRSTASEWINRFNNVTLGKENAGYLGTGNAHSVMAAKDLVYLECEHADEMKVLLTISHAIAALQHYCSFLSGDIKNADHLPKPFEVEYEAEGQRALDLYLETGGSLGLSRSDIEEHNRKIK